MMKAFFTRIPDTIYVFAVFFIFFVLNLTSNFSGPHDSMGYLNDFLKGRDLFPAHHILYHYITYSIFHLFRFLFHGVRDYYLVETVDTIWGCLGLTMVYRILLRRVRMTQTEAFLGTCVAAFSFGMWFYCSNIEVYMPSTFFLLWGLYICMKADFGKSDVIPLILIHCLAVLFHQSNVLFGTVVLWRFWHSRRTIPFFRSCILYALISVVLVGSTYLFIGWVVEGHNNLKDFNIWIRGYTLQSDYWFPFSLSTLFKAMVGFGHAFFGGHYIFKVRFLQSIMNRVFYYHSLDDEAYLVRHLSYKMAVFLLVLTIVVCLAILFLLVRIILNCRTLYRSHRNLFVPPLLFLATFSTFFFFWMPENLEFWIPTTSVFWIFLLGLNKQLPALAWPRRYYLLPGILAGLLLIVNYAGSIYWMKNINNDSVYVKVEKVKGLATEKDIILLQDPWLLDDFLEYFTKSAIWRIPTDRQKIDSLNTGVNACLSSGGKVYLFTEGGSMHSSKNRTYIDSLLTVHAGKVTDINNNLTPVKVISN